MTLPKVERAGCRPRRVWRGPAAAQQGGDAGQQLVDAERLGEVVVGAQVEGPHLVLLAPPGRHHDDPDRGVGPDVAAQVEAVGAGQHQVEQDEVGLVVAHQVDDVLAGAGDEHGEAADQQVGPDQVDDVAVVLDHAARGWGRRSRRRRSARRRAASGRLDRAGVTATVVPRVDRLEADRPAVGVDDAPGDGQAEAGPGPCGRCPARGAGTPARPWSGGMPAPSSRDADGDAPSPPGSSAARHHDPGRRRWRGARRCRAG